MTQSQLATKLGCTPAAVSQFLDDDANLKVETIAKVFLALGRQAKFQSVHCDAQIVAAKSGGQGGGNLWQVEDPVLVEHKAHDTTAKIMAVFRDTGRTKLPAGKSNDNSSFYDDLVGQAA